MRETDKIHWYAYVLPCAVAMALGWGVRGQYGGEKGAVLAGAMLAAALGLVTRDPAKRRRAPWIVLAGLGFGFGGMMSYGEITGYVAHPERGVGFPSEWAMLQHAWGVRLWGLAGMGIVAGIWGWLAGLFLGVAVTDRAYGWRDGLAIVVLAIVGGIVGHALFIKWLGVTTSSRSDFWATLLGVTAAFYIYAAAAKRDRAARVLGFGGLIGFGLAFPLLHLMHVFLSPHVPLRWYDWWKIVEQGLGLFGGAAIALGLFYLDRSGHRAREAIARPRLERAALAFAVWLPVFWNGRNNFTYWCYERKILAAQAVEAWRVVGEISAIALTVWVMHTAMRPIARRYVVVAYLILIWFATIGSGLKMAFPYSGIGWVTVQIGFTLMAVALTAHALLVGRER